MSKCYHCGDQLPQKAIHFKEKDFCCQGCANVYELLQSNLMMDFYEFEKNPGTRPSHSRSDKYQFLDIPEIRSRFIQYEDEDIVRVKLSLPTIHCSSCIYLLENLTKINPKVKSSQVHFAKKEASIVMGADFALSELADLLQFIGYAPDFGKRTEKKHNQKSFLLKIGLAGFAFGSIMLWSAPDYFGMSLDNPSFRNFTSFLSFFVSLPVFLYSAQEYYLSAYKALRSRSINLDLPITLGILALYAQSTYQIFTLQGPGYMDSFAGFIFFLLIGKWFQNRTYQSLSFDRDFSSYFPVAIQRKGTTKNEIVPIEKLIKGSDHIVVRNEEIIPCDCILVSVEAQIDYSFVTGESALVTKKKGDLIYAGGKLMGLSIELEVKEETNRSHLTELWNETKNKKEAHELVRYQDRISSYFLKILLLIALGAGISWYFISPHNIMTVVVSVLIVACPCALALSSPFTFGNTMNVLGKNGLYIKNSTVIESLAEIDTIVFDKTGTLTDPLSYQVVFSNDMSEDDWNMLKSLSSHSTHPLSKLIHTQLSYAITVGNIQEFREIKSQGIECKMNDHYYQLGNHTYVGVQDRPHKNGVIYFAKNGKILQEIAIKSNFRPQLENLLKSLSDKQIFVVSGDDDKDLYELISLGFHAENCFFKQEPKDKAKIISALQKEGKKVIMVGDGLNDVGALGSANVGVALSEDMFRFTPSSDAILNAAYLPNLASYFKAAKYAKKVLKICLAFSITYNIIGLSFAITASLEPIVAAILMPISSITIVFLSTALIQFRYLRGIH